MIHKILFPVLQGMQKIGKKVFDGLDRIGLRGLRPIVLRAWWRVIDAASRFHPNVTEVAGHRMYLDAQDSCRLAIFGVHDRPVADVFEKYIKPGDVVVDVGAHIGFFTLLSAKLVGPTGKVFAFEPEPSNFALLKKNVDANRYTNVVVTQKAVSDRTGTIQLHVAESSSGLHRIYKSELFGATKAVEVETTTLDGFLGENARIDFIKMDIEGAEPAAIEGMSNLLRANPRAMILTEFSPAAIGEFGVDPRAFLESLASRGYRVLYVGAAGEEPMPFDELMRIYAPATGMGANLLLVPGRP